MQVQGHIRANYRRRAKAGTFEETHHFAKEWRYEDGRVEEQAPTGGQLRARRT